LDGGRAALSLRWGVTQVFETKDDEVACLRCGTKAERLRRESSLQGGRWCSLREVLRRSEFVVRSSRRAQL